MFEIGTINTSGVFQLDGLGSDPESNQFETLEEAVAAVEAIVEAFEYCPSIPAVREDGRLVWRRA